MCWILLGIAAVYMLIVGANTKANNDLIYDRLERERKRANLR